MIKVVFISDFDFEGMAEDGSLGDYDDLGADKDTLEEGQMVTEPYYYSDYDYTQLDYDMTEEGGAGTDESEQQQHTNRVEAQIEEVDQKQAVDDEHVGQAGHGDGSEPAGDSREDDKKTGRQGATADRDEL